MVHYRHCMTNWGITWGRFPGWGRGIWSSPKTTVTFPDASALLGSPECLRTPRSLLSPVGREETTPGLWAMPSLIQELGGSLVWHLRPFKADSLHTYFVLGTQGDLAPDLPGDIPSAFLSLPDLPGAPFVLPLIQEPEAISPVSILSFWTSIYMNGSYLLSTYCAPSAVLGPYGHHSTLLTNPIGQVSMITPIL